MNRVELHNEPYNSNDSGQWAFSLIGSAKFLACAVVILMATLPPSVLADEQVYGYVGPTGLMSLTNVPTNERVAAVRRKARYHSGVADLELEQAVNRAAQQHHVQPALLLAVMKAESSFNPIAVSKAGAVGLMQLIPETAIRHGVRNLYDTNDNITGGAKHLRYLLDRFHGNIRFALLPITQAKARWIDMDRFHPIKKHRNMSKRCLDTIVATKRTVGSCRL